MKRNLKLFGLFVVMVLVVSLFVACGSDNADKNDTDNTGSQQEETNGNNEGAEEEEIEPTKIV